MANPASRLPEEDKPVTRPTLLNLEAGSSTSSTGSRGGGSSNSTTPTTGGSSTPTHGGEGGSSNDTGGGLWQPGKLRDQEENPDQDSDTSTITQPNRRRRKVQITRRRVIIGGSTGLIIGVSMAGISVIQGPLEFIHISQLLNRFHFLSQQDAEDNRVVKIVRYLHDPTKPQNTRLGIVGNAIANKIETDMREKLGIEPKYNKASGRFEGYVVDREHPRFKDKKTSQIKDILASAGVDRSWFDTPNTPDGRQEIRINPEKNLTRVRDSLKAYRTELKFNRYLLGTMGYSAKAAYAGSRIEKIRAGWEFRPIRKLDAKIQASAVEAGKKGIDKLKKQFYSDQAKAESGDLSKPQTRASPGEQTNADGTTNQSGQDSASQVSAQANDTVDAGSSLDPTDEATTKQFTTKTAAKLAAGGSFAAAGVACVMKGIDENISQNRDTKVMQPMRVKGGKAISLGSQAQSNSDISLLQLGFYKDFLDKKDDKGSVVSTWDQAQSIQAELGNPNSGTDLPKEGRVFNKGTPFDFVDGIPGIKTFCSVLSSTPGQIFGIITGPLNYLVSSEILKQGIPALAGWLSGAPISPLAAGADYGNYINYGAKLLANDQYAAAGGVPLGSSDVLALKNTQNQLDKTDFGHKSLAYKIFNVYDSRTIAASFIDSQGNTNFLQKGKMFASSFADIFTSLIKLPASLLTTSVKAAASQTYDYHGVKTIGFTAGELTDKTYEDPFDNACRVVGCPEKGYTGILNDPAKADKYISLASKCFGAEISNDGTNWSIDTKTKAVNMYDKAYPDGDCKSKNTDWVRIRFWLLDSVTAEGLDCYLSSTDTSDASCQNVGFDSGGNSNTQSNDRGNAQISGDSQKLAKKILASDKITIGTNPKSSLEAAAKGQLSPAGVDRCGDQHQPVEIDSTLLAFIYDLSQFDTFTINSLTTGEHVCTSNHYKGKAVDFGCDLDTAIADRIGKKYGISHNYESCSADPPHWHYSIGGG